MKFNPTPIRIEPAYEDRENIRAMFERYAPYRALESYAPRGIKDETDGEPKQSVLPWFRGDWALEGKPLVNGADLILHNKSFIEGARTAFGTSFVNPEFVAVNINGPMPASPTHMDNPSFYGASRGDYPLPFLRVMGFSGLFEAWRVIRASTISWFYEGAGGSFDYWPKGLDGPMVSERSPFGNIFICADNDRMYHRVGATGNGSADSPQISAAATIQPDGEGKWTITERGEVRAIYPCDAIRFSVLWKAEVWDGGPRPNDLTLDRIMAVIITDLRQRVVEFSIPSDPLSDTEWIFLLQRIYAPEVECAGGDPPDSVVRNLTSNHRSNMECVRKEE
jgi:hypothetical protein